MNIWLHGNGHWCGECLGTGRGAARDRIEYEGGGACQFYDNCDACGGARRLSGSGKHLSPPLSFMSQTIQYEGTKE